MWKKELLIAAGRMEVLFHGKENAEKEMNSLGIKSTVLLVQIEMPIIYSNAGAEWEVRQVSLELKGEVGMAVLI